MRRRIGVCLLAPVALLHACAHPVVRAHDPLSVALKRCGARYEDFAWYPHLNGGVDFHADPTQHPIPEKAACMKRWAAAQHDVTFEDTQY